MLLFLLLLRLCAYGRLRLPLQVRLLVRLLFTPLLVLLRMQIILTLTITLAVTLTHVCCYYSYCASPYVVCSSL